MHHLQRAILLTNQSVDLRKYKGSFCSPQVLVVMTLTLYSTTIYGLHALSLKVLIDCNMAESFVSLLQPKYMYNIGR